MKGRDFIAVALSFSIWLLPKTLWADLTVHQVDKWRVAGEDKEMTQRLIMYVKGKMVRLEQTPGEVVIFRFPDKKMIELDPEQKIYTEISLEALQKLAELSTGLVRGLEEITGRKPKGTPAEGFHVVPTGEQQTISGFPCELYRVEGKEFSGDFWITQATDAGSELYPIQKEMAEFTKDIIPGVGRDVVEELERIGGTVILFMARFKTPAGDLTIESQAEQILRDPLPETLFQPPADFSRKTDLKNPVEEGTLEKGLQEIMKKLK